MDSWEKRIERVERSPFCGHKNNKRYAEEEEELETFRFGGEEKGLLLNVPELISRVGGGVGVGEDQGQRVRVTML